MAEKVRIGINGFGRIGRVTCRAILEEYSEQLEVVAVNDLFPVATNAHLFKYDTNYGTFPGEVECDEHNLIVNGCKIRVYEEKDPANIPWGDHGVDIVLECTGVFRDGAQAAAHLKGGVKKVIISAPPRPSGSAKTLVLGVNEDTYDPAEHHVLSNASCTTNCLAPLAKALHEEFCIVQGFMTTIHAYTNDQRVMDQAHKDLRRARAAAANIIPTSTGAAAAIGLVIPDLEGKLDGIALRVPTTTVSVVDLVCTVETELVSDPKDKEQRQKAIEQVNEALQRRADGTYLAVCAEELVSGDFKGDPRSSIVDLPSTNVIGPNMVKVLAWYDNEWAYSCRLAELAQYAVDRFCT
ncbi:MAG TPA: type I glyceraldehyde-3-phosphate dehydrogenase [Armatimonadetes bacterium]|nr:type I glyceraldehyde-3-phosphate dehydrogenase [Armatimonadota bacterium]